MKHRYSDKTALWFALPKSTNSLHSLATWPVPKSSISAITSGQWHTVSSNL